MNLTAQRIYVKRLKRMIERYDTDSCSRCPAGKRFRRDANSIEDLRVVSVCNFCTDFIGLNPDSWLCPCGQLGPQEAISRAHKAIAAWEKEHGEV